MDECPYCGEPAHLDNCRPQVGRNLAEVRMLREFDVSVADVLLKLAEHEDRLRQLEREQREWH